MIADAAKAGAECVKFQMHILDDEMSSAAKKTIPGNAKTSIWHIIKCTNLTINPAELKQLITGAEAIRQARGGSKRILVKDHLEIVLPWHLFRLSHREN